MCSRSDLEDPVSAPRRRGAGQYQISFRVHQCEQVRIMENTQTNRFEKNEAEFFLPAGSGFGGPFRPSEVQQKLDAGEIRWVDHCFRETEGWVRICDHSLFKVLQPPAPEGKPKIRSEPPPVPAEALVPRVKWYLFQHETQSGPYPAIELRRLAGTGQISPDAFVWQEAFRDWMPISEVPDFAGIASSGKKSERRESPRKPLVAGIYLTNDREVASGMCRDISVGGMQVLTDAIPGKPGDTIHLNVMPPDSSGLSPFVAHGTIVRILEDRRGFSFRFTGLGEEAKRSIERYIS
ncbi:MAG: DUF4339 domain-containing protein [Proteobacteria bacterium]|nr:DUF4339 domain-containing protein [Pseudomonadota bacterium]